MNWFKSLQPIYFAICSVGPTNKRSLQFPLLLFSKLGHDTEAQLTDVFHCLLGVLAAHELDVAESLGQAYQLLLGEPVFMVLHEFLLECPMMCRLVW